MSGANNLPSNPVDDSIDEQLRAYARRWTVAQPVVPRLDDVLPDLTTSPRHSGRWRPILAVACAVLAVAAGSVVLSLHSRREHNVGSPPAAPVIVVPYRPGGVATTHVQVMPYTKPPLGTPPCHSADFALLSSRTTLTTDRPRGTSFQAVDGTLTTSYVLRSTARSGCAFNGHGVRVELVDRAGRPLTNDFPAPGPPYGA